MAPRTVVFLPSRRLDDLLDGGAVRAAQHLDEERVFGAGLRLRCLGVCVLKTWIPAEILGFVVCSAKYFIRVRHALRYTAAMCTPTLVPRMGGLRNVESKV